MATRDTTERDDEATAGEADPRFPDFDGWTVAYDEARTAFDFVKPHPGGKPGPDGTPRLAVSIRGTGLDPALVYERGVRDALAEEARVSDDPAVAARFAAAERAVVARKVRHGLAKGFGVSYAVERMTAAGFSVAEMDAVLRDDRDAED